MRLHLVGEYVPIFPTEFLGFRIRRLHKLYSLSRIYFHESLVTNDVKNVHKKWSVLLVRDVSGITPSGLMKGLFPQSLELTKLTTFL